MTEFGDMARRIIASNRYMVLGTADESGVPWVTPVWYAQSDYSIQTAVPTTAARSRCRAV